jgi:hypothetical protein
MIKKISLAFLSAILIISCQSRRLVVTDVEAPMFTLQISSKVPKELFNTWILSDAKESDEKLIVYRSLTNDNNLQTINNGFKIDKSGRFIELDKDLDTGKWIYSNHEKTLDISFSHIVADPIPETKNIKKPYSLRIISLDNSTLKVYKMSN